MWQLARRSMLVVPFLITLSAVAQERPATVPVTGTAPRPQTPPLLFRQDWQVVPNLPPQHPVTPASISVPTLELKLYGPSGKDIQMTGAPNIPGNLPYLWTGLCEQTCAVALRDKNNYLDLSGLGKIRWDVKTSGLHQIHPIVKLADGTWLLGEHGDVSIYDFHFSEFTLSESRWIRLDIDKVVTRGRWVEKPDLSKVDEVGFTDLMPGSGHGDGGYSDVGVFEAYGKPVPRAGAATK